MVNVIVELKSGLLISEDISQQEIDELRQAGINVESKTVLIKVTYSSGDTVNIGPINPDEFRISFENTLDRIQRNGGKLEIIETFDKEIERPTDGPSFENPQPTTNIISQVFFRTDLFKANDVTKTRLSVLIDYELLREFTGIAGTAQLLIRNPQTNQNLDILEKSFNIDLSGRISYEEILDGVYPTLEIEHFIFGNVGPLSTSIKKTLTRADTPPDPFEQPKPKEKDDFFKKAVGVAAGFIAAGVLATGFGGNPFKQAKNNKGVKNGKKKN